MSFSVWRSSLKTAKKTGTGLDPTDQDRKLLRPEETETTVWSSVHQYNEFFEDRAKTGLLGLNRSFQLHKYNILQASIIFYKHQ